MSKSDHRTCNRRPFLSEEGCDRGSVDIYQFDDFPYCETVNPTMPAIPPEIVDNPLQIPVPPSCACVNIKYALKLKYSKDRKFGAEASFSAQGDCCEGNYVSNFDLQIPCPILGKGSKKFKLKIGYGSGKASAAASYIRTNPDSCTVEAKDVDIRLDIPCPVKDSRGKKIKIGISYGNGNKTASASFLVTDAKNCTVEALAPTFNLNLPCPVKRQRNTPKIKAKIKWGSSGQSASASFLTADPDSCQISGIDAVLNLNIPCPIKGKGAKHIKIGSHEIEFVKFSNSTCEMSFNDASFDIDVDVPCPINPQGTRNIKFGELKFGVPTPVIQNLATLTNCNISMQSPEFNLNVPCALQNIKIEKGTVKTEGSTGSITIGDTGSPAHASCSRTFTIDVTFPKGGTSIEKEVVTDMRYQNHTLEIELTKFESGKTTSRWKKVFTAVSHKSDHVCCNDA